MSRVASPLTVHMYLHTYIDHEVLVHKTSFSTFALPPSLVPSLLLYTLVCMLPPSALVPGSSFFFVYDLWPGREWQRGAKVIWKGSRVLCNV